MTEAITIPGVAANTGFPKLDAPAAAARRILTWAFALALSVYLALSGGGYDIIVRSEVGLIVWWFVLLGVLIGVLPRARWERTGWIATALLSGFLLWSWIGLSWSNSHELTLNEVCRLSTYLGIFLLGLCVLTSETAPSLLNGLGCGIAAVSAVAIMAKLAPSLFPADTARSFYATARLSYPFDYADGVGEYAALGIPLVLRMATGGRTLAGRAIATAAMQPLLLCLAMTVSRGGILAAGVGVIAYFALVPDRLPRLPTLAIVAAGIAVLMIALLHRPALRDWVNPAPAGQRHSMFALLCAVVAVTGLLQMLSEMVMRRTQRPSRLRVSRRGAQMVTASVVLVAAAVVAVGFAAGTVSHFWNEFKLWEPKTNSNQYFRLLSLAGSHRYQYWQVAWHAFTSSPLHGIGSGTFRFYWEQHTHYAEYIVNAHSLWFETLAETGIVGWLLLAGFFALILIGGAVRALRSGAAHRNLVATATAGVFAFCAAASFDWVWQIGVVPMVMLLLAAVTLVPEDRAVWQPAASGPRASWNRGRGWAARGSLGLAAIVAMILIAVPLASTVALRSSQAAYRANNLSQALSDANTAVAIEPGAASPYLQRAQIFEAANHIGAARQQIAAAIARAPHDYQLWLIASRLATEADHPREAIADYLRAKALYPTSLNFLG
jgi:hypothetical protein